LRRRYLGGGLRRLTMLLMDGGVGQLTIRMMDGGLRLLLRLMTIVGGEIILQRQLAMAIKGTHRTLPLVGEAVGVVVVVVVVVAVVVAVVTGEIDAGGAGEVKTAEGVETATVVTALVVVDIITLTHRGERIAGRTKSPARITRITRPGKANF